MCVRCRSGFGSSFACFFFFQRWSGFVLVLIWCGSGFGLVRVWLGLGWIWSGFGLVLVLIWSGLVPVWLRFDLGFVWSGFGSGFVFVGFAVVVSGLLVLVCWFWFVGFVGFFEDQTDVERVLIVEAIVCVLFDLPEFYLKKIIFTKYNFYFVI